MALGANRDYKTREALAWRQLRKHAARMEELVATGLGREEASSQAFNEMKQAAAAQRAKRETKASCPRCTNCGAVVRSGVFTGYEDQALCRNCEKERETGVNDGTW